MLNKSIVSIANMKEWTTAEEAANLKRLLSGVKNKAQFAKMFGVPGGASMLSQHQSGHRPISLEAAKAYAKGLGVHLDAISPRFAKLAADVAELSRPLSDSAFDTNVRPAPPGMRAYPVISKIQAGLVKEIACPYEPGDGFAIEFGEDDASQWAFFLEIDGDSMLPEFRPGDRVLIDPEVTPRPGDYVAARNTQQESTFKKYRVRGISEDGNEIFELVPLNRDYPVLRSDEHHLVVIGVMLEHRRKFRRR